MFFRRVPRFCKIAGLIVLDHQGKFMEIHFDKDARICGCKISQCTVRSRGRLSR